MKEWYRKEGFIQFLLGNEWKNEDAKITMIFCWIMIILGVVFPILAIIGFIK